MKRNVCIVCFPILIGLVVAFVLYVPLKNGIILNRLEFVLNSVITCAATFSGFILTSVSILIGLSESKLVKKMRDTGGLVELSTRYTESLIIGFVIIVFCVVLGGKTDTTNQVGLWWAISGIALMVSYAISVFLTGYYLLRVIVLIPNDAHVCVNNMPQTPEGEFRINTEE